MNASVIVVAAGRGERFGSNAISKAFHPLDGKPILAYVLEIFEKVDAVTEMIVVVHPKMMNDSWKNHLGKYKFRKLKKLVLGGETRADSVWKGLQEISKGQEIVLVHDAARPLITLSLVESVIQAACQWGGAIPGVKIKSTVKEVDLEGFILRTHAREHLWEAQTPQGFRFKLLKKAYELAGANRVKATDEALLFEQAGYRVKVVEGDSRNIKITTQEDLAIAQMWRSSL